MYRYRYTVLVGVGIGTGTELFIRKLSTQYPHKVGFCHSITVSIVFGFHKHNSFLLGPIQSFISDILGLSWIVCNSGFHVHHFWMFCTGN